MAPARQVVEVSDTTPRRVLENRVQSAPASTGPIKFLETDLVPREGQHVGAVHLATHRRAALWDVPGYGKTLMAALAAKPPVSIVAPTYLINKWRDWLETHVPSAVGHVYKCSGQGMDRGHRIDALYEASHDSLGWTLTNKEMWRPELEAYVDSTGLARHRVITDRSHQTVFEYGMPLRRTLILDEAHHLRVNKAWHTYGIQMQNTMVPYIFQLTATPIYKDVVSLFAQLRTLNPYMFKSVTDFKSMYAKMWNDGWADVVIGVKNLDVLMSNLANYAIARDYLPGEVPDVYELDDIVVDTNPATAARIKQITKDYRDGQVVYTSASQAINALMRLSICTEKLEAVADFILDNNKRFDTSMRGTLVLVKHVDGAAKPVVDYLRKATKLNWTLITGETNRDKRASLAEHADNVVGTYDAMSEGVDCSHLSIVCRVEPWYLPGQDYQGISRSIRQRHSSHPRPIPLRHREEPVLVQSFRLKVGPDKAIYDTVRHRISDARTVLNTILATSERE